jgi:DinB superfamily
MPPIVLGTPPEPHEAPPYYFKYISLVPPGDIRELLGAQLASTLSLLGSISEDTSRFRYAADKWSIRQVLGHVNDCERLFAFRAFWFARGFDSPLPSFDQNVAAQHDTADARSWSGLVAEFREIRASTLSLVRHLPDDAWLRRGAASGHEFTVRSLAYIIAGHVAHHDAVVRQRYLPLMRANRRDATI